MKNFKKYKKTILLVIFYLLISILGFYLFEKGFIDQEFVKGFIDKLGWLGFIILGILYSQGITGPIAAGILVLYSGTHSPWLIAFLGGLGTGLVDLLMYELFRYEIHSELKNLKRSKFFKKLGQIKIFKDKLIMTFLGFMIIASPLSDDFGTILIEEEGMIKTKYFFLIDMILNMAGIYFFLSI